MNALRENAKLRDECDAPAAVSGSTVEYKQVTVLFADVVRSMDMAAALDIERLREIMTELLENSAAVVRRYGGTVEYNGDEVMALFGAPITLEDHAFRACLAALAIQEEANRLAAEVQRRDGVALQVRVGLNSGRVIAGEIGSGSLGYAATGVTVGYAQRMEAAAPAGGVLLTESTARLVDHLAALAEPEWVRIKGADEPVRARRLLAPCCMPPTCKPEKSRKAGTASRSCGSSAARPGTRPRWPSATRNSRPPSSATPGARVRSPAGRKQPQPPVDHRRRPRRGQAVLEQQVVIDQHRHPLRDHRPVLDIPGPPAPRREVAQDHGHRQ